MRDLPTGTVTFLLTDIEGSTRLLGQLGGGYREVLDDHHRLLREVIEAAGGTEVSTEGDAFFVVFTNAPAAVAAAAGAQQALAAHRWPEDGVVRVRMGLHTGEGVLGGDDYTGIDLHRAARIAAAGHGGQVLLSHATQTLVAQTLPEGMSLRDLGEHQLKDLAHPERLFQLEIPGLPSDFPPVRSLDLRRGNLPRQLTSFVGRQRELEEVGELLERSRLVTLTGPGGAGKTRLSLQVAAGLQDRFEDGAFFVNLAPITDAELVVPTINDTLGVVEDAEHSPMDGLIAHLRDKDLLLVLDNFEQVTAAAPAVGELLAGSEAVRVLVTTREALDLAGEQQYPVPPLALPDPAHLPPLDALSQFEAVRLFVDRARSVKPGFGVTNENAPAVAEICARLDGLPLAIELAAARVKILSPETILKRLANQLSLLAGGPRDRPQRQQTLRDAIAWSYDLLDEHDRGLFARLSVFRGGFDLEGAEAISGDGTDLDALEGVASLTNKSLLRQMTLGGAEDRFVMLETIREFAAERLADTPEAAEVHERHARHVLALVEEVVPRLFGIERAMWLEHLAHEHDNARAALEWALGDGSIELGLRLAGRMWRFWQMRGHIREGRDWLTRVLAHPRAGEFPAARADALEGLGGILYWMGDAEGLKAYEECLALRRELGEPEKTAEALYNLACMHVFGIGVPLDVPTGQPLMEEALQIYRSIDDRSGVAKVQWVLGGSYLRAGRLEEAEVALAEAGALHREEQDVFGEGWAVHMLGITLLQSGRLDDARERFERAMELFLEGGDKSAIPVIVYDFALLAHASGESDRALRLASAADNMSERVGVGLQDSALAYVGELGGFITTLSAGERKRAREEVASLSDEEILELALGHPASSGAGGASDARE